MLVSMAKVNIVGHRSRLDATLGALHRSGRIQVIDVTDDSGVLLPPLTADEIHLQESEDLRSLRTRLDSLLRLVPAGSPRLPPEPPAVDLEQVSREVERAGPAIEENVGRLDRLRQEAETLPRHLEALKRLLPLMGDVTSPESYETAALLVDARHTGVLAELNAHLTDLLEGNFEMVSDRVDAHTVGAVLIYPRRAAREVAGVLGREQVSRVRLPERFEGLPFRRALAGMEGRLTELPEEIRRAEEAVADVVRAYPHWPAARRAAADRLEQLGAIRSLGATPHTFVLSAWVPAEELEALRIDLDRHAGPAVLVEEVEVEEGEEPPVLMRNPGPVRPYQSLVTLLQVPRYGTLDPAALMAFFLPLFFGMMLGDVVYGLLLAVGASLLGRKVKRGGFAQDLTRILMVSGGWAAAWGVVYGEYLGDLGRRLWGLGPLWIDREEAITPLLLFALAVGAAHVVLGLILGIWQAHHAHDRQKLGERVGMLIALGGLFAIAAAAAGALPEEATTPAVAATVVGLVLLVASGGVMGLLMGPLDLMGTVGNILSYLRIAAIGLASVYLARVANELGAAGPVWIGILVASLFHALNLILGVFSPTIQALRLHYVEFFGKFYEGGGRPFTPFGNSSNGPASAPTPQTRRTTWKSAS